MIAACTPPQDRPRWMLVLTTSPYFHIMALTEDCAKAATDRGWTILATESDIFEEPI